MTEIDYSYPANLSPKEDDLVAAAARILGTDRSQIDSVAILKRSLDARSAVIIYRCRLVVYMKGEQALPQWQHPPKRDVSKAEQVVVVGSGPAGLFASLELISKGFKPVILERGAEVHRRRRDCADISRAGLLHPESNYCFGEGGAGTFSDGKLYTRSSKRGDVGRVLGTFVAFGAPESILWDAHPHIGSDRLPAIIEAMRNFILECGGEYHFDARVDDLQRMPDGSWRVRWTPSGEICARNVILSAGHSASDIFAMFASKGWALETKGFAMGVRVEHPRELIDRIQYHRRVAPGTLPSAEYSLVEQVEGRGVFSFCMCPGGVLVPSATSAEALVLNGMSASLRNSPFSNAGIVVQINPEDIPSEYAAHGPLAGLRWQEDVERACFAHSGSQSAPAQRMTDFVEGRFSSALPRCSYAPGAVSAGLKEVLPEHISARLRKAFRLFDRKMRGFYTREALLLAVESRTSSPVRIPRDSATLQHIALPGLYPCGEGAGYAGGIVSSALDGIACASRIQ